MSQYKLEVDNLQEFMFELALGYHDDSRQRPNHYKRIKWSEDFILYWGDTLQGCVYFGGRQKQHSLILTERGKTYEI